MKNQLEEIVNICIKNKNFNKLRYIGQSLDVMLFMKEYQDYKDIFYKINNYLHINNINLLGRLEERNYKDLNEIGLIECITFK